MVSWALSGDSRNTPTHPDSVFGLSVPDAIPGIPTELLYPERTWPDQSAFIDVANSLKASFRENIQRFEITQRA
jgi:phosphoenolpyruvate carboxykinase (ATP)